ncbi:DUF2461 domain-containing protein [Rhizohabitans arisaemae]|uniref:DUF2461 domain-containing protein n=1 Tax=Rhizohabitans arisaemae TaxID=2720610 RepID=UPI0024B0A8F8|nr:DUF2461 domain-containing protein [Rhizohabitans arisaemae]
MAFTGFSAETFAFYDRLAADNTKEFMKREKAVYDRAVHAPMAALAEELSGEFGEVQVLRPQRDSRFSNDKSPYKIYQGAYTDTEPCLGYWVQVDAGGLYVSGRFYPWATEQVTRFRAAVEDDVTGPGLAAIVAVLRDGGFQIGGERLKTAPRGYPKDHSRIDLIRHKKIDAGLRFAPAAWMHTGEPLARVREIWRALTPMLDWISVNAKPTP